MYQQLFASARARRRRLIAATATAVVLLVAVVTAALVFTRPGPTTPRARTTPTPLHLTFDTHLTSVAMVSATEGWAVGFEGPGTHPYLLHLRHNAWAEETLPPVRIVPQAIAMVSASEGWIAGADAFATGAHGVLLHGLGGQWSAVALPAQVGPIAGLAMLSPSEGWAVATNHAEDGHARILHYVQGAWTIAFSLPDASTLLSIAMVSPTEGWAAGANASDTSASAIWHFASGAWQSVALTDPARADLEYISMRSPDEGWGIGVSPLPAHQGDQYARQAGAIWHYSGGQWQVEERYADDPGQAVYLTALLAVAPDDVWVAEADGTGKRFLHRVGGAWQKVSAPIRDGINNIAMVSASEGWAVGDAGQMLHYAHGAWVDAVAL